MPVGHSWHDDVATVENLPSGHATHTVRKPMSNWKGFMAETALRLLTSLPGSHVEAGDNKPATFCSRAASSAATFFSLSAFLWL